MAEIIKELPAVFEEFGEARRNSFLAVKEFKDKGIPVIGSYCTYFPQEIALAMGAAAVGLCSTSDETISDAEKDLPRNLCPLIKSSYGFAKTEKCPFFYFSDVVIGETTCDGKKKMYELMQDFKDVFILQLPQKQDHEAVLAYKGELNRLRAYLENKFGVTIKDDNLRDAVKLMNEIRRDTENLANVMRQDPCPISGHDLFKVLYGSTFKMDRSQIPAELKGIKEKIDKEYADGVMQEKKPRIILTGCPLAGATEKVIDAIENNGGIVVGYENCTGAKQYDRLVDEDADDIMEAIADRYLQIGCSVMTPNNNRYDLLGRMIDDFKADGVIDMTLTTCLTYAVESTEIRRFVTDQKGIPYLNVETDYSKSDIEQLNTRITAFIEML